MYDLFFNISFSPCKETKQKKYCSKSHTNVFHYSVSFLIWCWGCSYCLFSISLHVWIMEMTFALMHYTYSRIKKYHLSPRKYAILRFVYFSFFIRILMNERSKRRESGICASQRVQWRETNYKQQMERKSIVNCVSARMLTSRKSPTITTFFFVFYQL